MAGNLQISQHFLGGLEVLLAPVVPGEKIQIC